MSKDSDFIDPDLSEEDDFGSGPESGEEDLNGEGIAVSSAGPSSRPQRAKRATRDAKGKEKKRTGGGSALDRVKGKKGEFSWEAAYERSWDNVREDERGSLESAVSDLLLSNGIKRVLRDTTSIQRGIIRHVYLVIDLSLAMLVREFKATWLELTLGYARVRTYVSR